MTNATIKPVFAGIREVKTIAGWKSTNTLNKRMWRDGFPRPIKIDGRNHWVLSEVYAWIDAQIAKARTHTEPK